ncbi:lysine N-methyltransferase [Aureococcus anophagefferens]|nr:lysine N-methyltransferase [Aureococcus anophagefferens]
MADFEDQDWKPGALNLRREVHVRTTSKTYVVTQDANSSEPGAMLWEVSIIVAKLLDAGALGDDADLAGRAVLELGAGCAVAGMAYAGGARVTFTDLPALCGHVRDNVARNLGPDGYRVVPYDWCDGRGDAPFLDALDAVAGPRTTVVLAFERRDEAVLAAFERGLRDMFKCRPLLSTKKLRAILGDDVLLRPADDGGEPDARWLSILVCKKRKSYARRPVRARDGGAAAFDATRAAFAERGSTSLFVCGALAVSRP